MNTAIRPTVETAEHLEVRHLPDPEWNRLSKESQETISKWFNLAVERLQAILDEPAERPEGGEGPYYSAKSLAICLVAKAESTDWMDLTAEQRDYWLIVATAAIDWFGASPVPSAAPTCPCCKSYNVTLERNEISRWAQCHNPRCGLTTSGGKVDAQSNDSGAEDPNSCF